MEKNTIASEAKDTGTTWAKLRGAAQNQVFWKGIVVALCSSRSSKDKTKQILPIARLGCGKW